MAVTGTRIGSSSWRASVSAITLGRYLIDGKPGYHPREGNQMLRWALTVSFLLFAQTAWADCVSDIQATIDACTKGGCEIAIAPQTCELGGAGLVVDKPGIKLRAAAGWSQVGVGVVLR